MDVATFGLEPVFFPEGWLRRFLAVFLYSRDVAENCFHPDIDGLFISAFEWRLDSPSQISRDRAGLQSISYPAETEVSGVFRKIRVFLHVFLQLFGELRKVEEPSL